MSPAFNVAAPANNGATFNKPIESAAAPRQGVVASEMAKESSTNGRAVHASIQEVKAKLDTGRKPGADAGAGTGGSSFAGKVVGAIGFTALAAASPVAAAVIAVKEGANFIMSSKSALAEYEGQSSFKDLSKSTKYGRASKAENEYASAQLETYTDAMGETYKGGFATRAPASVPGQMPQRRWDTTPADAGISRREEKVLETQLGTLNKQAGELATEGQSARKWAFDNSTSMAQGWTPPKVTGPLMGGGPAPSI
jgi:hypothetical protein